MTEAAPSPADFILTRRHGLASTLIALGQRRRYPRSACARWSHAGILTGRGTVVEALTRGVVETPLTAYQDIEHVVVRVDATPEQRSLAVKFADHAVGRRYGWVEIVSLAVSLLTGTGLSVNVDNQMICSGLVAECLCRTAAIFPREPARMLPADLAAFYEVTG